MDQSQKPFSTDYVLKTTTKHMRRSLELSIRKTLERIPEFASQPEKALEVFTTIAVLQSLKNTLDSFQQINSNHFTGK